MKEGLTAFIVGLLFGVGLTISGMTQPQKVIAFLDFFGEWDPSLMFVMIGAIGVHFIGYRLIRRKTSPLLADAFRLPEERKVDRKLVAGSALFGVGWGAGGYCPGPALTSLATFDLGVLIFVSMMVIGMLLHARLNGARGRGARAD